jgi:hypothetical protein
MSPKLIVMLTNHDQTVKNALDLFEQCKDLPVQHWGFKDVGLPVNQMKKLVANMKESGKTAYLEVVSYTEAECLNAAELAVECGFDYLMGTCFYPAVFALLKNKIQYFPFCGKVSGSPSILEGSIQEIIDDAKTMEQIGVNGVDLLAYRHVQDPERLAAEFVKAVKIPVVIAGSISSFSRIDRMKELNPWGFTIGGAFFDKKFDGNAPFKEQIKIAYEYLQK